VERLETNGFGFRCRTRLVTFNLWTKPSSDGWNSKTPDVCYHASMLTEEGRLTVFRVVFLDSQSPVSPMDDDELPPVTRYLLKEPVPFT
jgi:hypothetical protein